MIGKYYEYKRKWADEHQDMVRESRERWKAKYKEERRVRSAQWRLDNPGWNVEYNRDRTLIINGKRVPVHKRPHTYTCELCGKTVTRTVYHHWDNKHPCLGLWLCLSCHKVAEGVERGLHIKYLQEKKGMVLC